MYFINCTYPSEASHLILIGAIPMILLLHISVYWIYKIVSYIIINLTHSDANIISYKRESNVIWDIYQLSHVVGGSRNVASMIADVITNWRDCGGQDFWRKEIPNE